MTGSAASDRWENCGVADEYTHIITLLFKQRCKNMKFSSKLLLAAREFQMLWY
jgi:hypothetical protein